MGPVSLVALFRQCSELCSTGFDPCHSLLNHYYILTKLVNIILFILKGSEIDSMHSFQMMNRLCLGYALVLWMLYHGLNACDNYNTMLEFLFVCLYHRFSVKHFNCELVQFSGFTRALLRSQCSFWAQHVANIFQICYLLGLINL